MRRVTLGQTGIEASCIGFGCASLGSRVGAEEGLRALEAAHEQGVDWLDLAPAYGRGEAEAIAARFLKGRRERVRVCTKVGLAPPGAGGGPARALVPLARRAVATLPGLRALVRRTGVQSNARLPLTPALIAGSLEESLRRLGTDHVDLYALHNAEVADLGRDEIRRALEAVLASGKARAVAVAGDAAAAGAAVAQGAPFSVVQMAAPAPGESAGERPGGAGAGVLEAARAAGLGAVLHSVLGVEGALARLEARVGRDASARAEVLAATGLSEPRAALARLLVERAFALNPEGVVLVSMFSERARSANLALAEGLPDPEVVALVDRLVR